METQYAEAKGELLFELNEKTTCINLKEFTSAGIKADYNLQGEVKGKYNAAHAETENVLIRQDGTSESEGRAIQMTNDGDLILLTLKVKGRNLSPPMIKLEAEVKFQTASQKLAWLNTAKGRAEGTGNLLTGEVNAKFYTQK